MEGREEGIEGKKGRERSERKTEHPEMFSEVVSIQHLQPCTTETINS